MTRKAPPPAHGRSNGAAVSTPLVPLPAEMTPLVSLPAEMTPLVVLAAVCLSGHLSGTAAQQSTPARPRSLQYLIRERQGALFARPPSRRATAESNRFEDVFRHNQQWYVDLGSGREAGHTSSERFQNDADVQPPDDGHFAPDAYIASAGADHSEAQQGQALGFSGSHVTRHTLLEESQFLDDAPFPADGSHQEARDIASTRTQRPAAKTAAFSEFVPLLSAGSPASPAVSSPVLGRDRDQFVHHSSSHEDDPTSYHVSSGYHVPATYHTPAPYVEEDNSLTGHLKKYGGAMAPLLLATGLLFLFPSVHTITSTSRRRRRRSADPRDAGTCVSPLFLVTQVRTLPMTQVRVSLFPVTQVQSPAFATQHPRSAGEQDTTAPART